MPQPPPPPPPQQIVTIRNKDVTEVNGRRSLNSFIDKVTDEANHLLRELQEWEKEHNLRRAAEPVSGTALAIYSLVMIASALIMAAPAMADTDNSSSPYSGAGPKYRSVKLVIKTNRWAAVSFMIGVKKVSFVLPPCDVDVDLSTEFWNAGDRFTSTLVGYTALATSSNILHLKDVYSELGRQAIKESAITNEVESSFEANIYISHQEKEYIPTILLSKSSTELYDAAQAA